MADPLISDLLQKIIKNLHVLHEFTAEEDISVYEALLRETIVNIHQLLGCRNNISEELVLNVDPSVSIGSLSVLVNSANNSMGKEVENDIFLQIQAVQSEGQGNRSDIIRSLVKLLAANKFDSNDRRPKRIRGSFSGIFVKLANLIDFFTRLREEAEEEIVIYINRCFNYEATFYSYLNNRINSNLYFNDGDAERLVTTLDKIIEREKPTEDKTTDDTGSSIFSYGSTDRANSENSNVSKFPLRFHSSSTSFNQLYQIFFQSLCLKETDNNGSVDKDYTKYIKIMLRTFKASKHINYFELNNFQNQVERQKIFYEFLVGKKDGKSGLLPQTFNQLNFEVLNHLDMFPELTMRSNAEVKLLPGQRYTGTDKVEEDYATMLQTKKDTYDFIMSKSNRNYLINCLHYIIALLNEFELNLNLKFPQLFNYYICLAFNEMPDSVNSSDYFYIEKVSCVAARLMELDDDNVQADEPQVKDTVFHFCRLVNQLSEVKEDQKSACTLLMILAKREFKRVTRDAEMAFHRWNDLALNVLQLNYSLVTIWYPLSKERTSSLALKRWYNKYCKWKKVREVTGKMADRSTCFNIFFNKWMDKVKSVDSLDNQVGIFTVRRRFAKWTKKSLMLWKPLNIAIIHQNHLIVELFFSLWKSRYLVVGDAVEAAEAFFRRYQSSKTLVLQEHAFMFWHEKLNKVLDQSASTHNSVYAFTDTETKYLSGRIVTYGEKLSQLLSVEKYFVLTNFFAKFKRAYEVRKRVFSFRQNQQWLFAAYIFKERWLKKIELQRGLKRYSEAKYLQIKKNTFLFWKHLKSIQSMAQEFRLAKILSNYFARWKMNYLYAIRCLKVASFSLSPMKLIFIKWLMLYKSNSLIDKNRFNSEKVIFECWASKYNDKQLLLSKAMFFEADILSERKFKKMFHTYKKLIQMKNTAHLNIQRKYFSVICSKKCLFSEKYTNLAMKKRTKLNFNDKISLLAIFNLWISHYEILREERSEPLVELYQNFLHENLSRRILECWVVNYNHSQYLSMEMSRKSEEVSRRSLLMRTTFGNWVTRTNNTKQLVETCYDFERRILQKKFVFIWYTQFTESAYLYDLYDDFMGGKEYAILRDFLSLWNMKYIKDVKRNHQSCSLFIRRGEIALLKSIFELWNYKIKSPNGINNSNDVFVDNERSMNSNLSPLANKSSRKNYLYFNEERDDQFKSYLNTPLKTGPKISPSTPGFSRNERISPTKLQETTMRAKNSRIDALRRHFSRARATSTPASRKEVFNKKENSDIGLVNKNNEAFVRLSPPHHTSTISFYPPDRPNFSDSIFAPNNKNQLGSIGTSELSGTAFDEKSLIATAKQMRRIRPIYIPIEEEGLEPRISPVRKLKEKLKNNDSDTIS